jgi:signal transduction histidine kinase
MTDPSALAWRIALTTALAWIASVILFAALSIALANQSQMDAVDSQLRAHALAAYGLGFWDAEGRYNDEFLLKEPQLVAGDVQVTVATPAERVFGPPVRDLELRVAGAMAAPQEELWFDEPARRGLAIAAYDDTDDSVVGAVIATTATGPARRATLRFAAIIVVAALVLMGLGLVLSRWISARLILALQASITEREQILAGAAHELRNPMAALLARVDSTPPGGAAEALPEIRQTVSRVSSMVERLLTWSRLNHATPKLEPVRLDLLVELCLEDDEPLQADATVVDGDARLLEVAVRNLIENARVHGGGVAGVKVADGRVEVRDRGQGIPSESLLAPFTKGDASPGSGLGLALVQRIAAKHGGRLEISPTVALVLPVVR